MRIDWPFDPTKTTDEFGWRTLQGKPNHHNGLDFWYSGIAGDAVRAVADGVVVEAGYHRELGYYVRIRHQEGPRLSTGYLHLNATPLVHVGQKVKRGHLLGHVGNTGLSLGDHLHFETWEGEGNERDSRRVNPRDFMAKYGSGHVVGAPEAAGGTATPQAGVVTRRVTRFVNRRIGAPSTTAKKGKGLTKGTVGHFTGFIRGQNVGGNNIWFRGTSGDYFHSGCFEGGASNLAGLKDLGTWKTTRKRWARLTTNWYYYKTRAAALAAWPRHKWIGPGDFELVDQGQTKGPFRVWRNGKAVYVGSRYTNPTIITK